LRLQCIGSMSTNQTFNALVLAWRWLPFRIKLLNAPDCISGPGFHDGKARCLTRRRLNDSTVDNDPTATTPPTLRILRARLPIVVRCRIRQYARVVTAERISAAGPAAPFTPSGIRPLPALRHPGQRARLVGTIFLFVKRERQIVFKTGPNMTPPVRPHEQMGVGPHTAFELMRQISEVMGRHRNPAC
jgi:hypothetical protein